jgi:hypothetical protein
VWECRLEGKILRRVGDPLPARKEVLEKLLLLPN